jgi:hypothetical protein
MEHKPEEKDALIEPISAQLTLAQVVKLVVKLVVA